MRHLQLGKLIGREAEVELVEASLPSLSSPRAGVVAIVGEAGIGKTHLTNVLVDTARARGALVVRGGAYEVDEPLPFAVLIDLLGQLVRDNPTLAEGVRDHQLLEVLRRFAPLLKVSAAPFQRLSAQDERYRFLDAASQLLVRASNDRPLLVVAEDVHWADRESWQAFRHMARAMRERAALLLLTARPDERGGEPDGLSDLARETNLRRVALQPLDLDGTTRLLEALAGERLPQAIAQTIHRESGGNPFYLRHVFEHLVEEGKLQRRQGRWSTDLAFDELGIPPGARSLLMRRIGRLSEPAVETLRLASIYPERFDLAHLRLLIERPDPSLLDQLDEALTVGVIVERDQGYSFAHALFRRALYDAMNPDRRALLHRHAAEQLARASSEPGEVARHYHSSRRIPGAEAGVAFALRAAERAMEARHYGHRAAFLRIAADLRGDRTEVESLRELALAQATALDIEAAESTANRLLERVGGVRPDGGGPPWLLDFLAGLARRLRDAGAAPALWLPFVDLGLSACGDRRDLAWARLAGLRPRWDCQWSGLVYKPVHIPTDPAALAILRTQGDEDDIAETLDTFEPRTEAETEAIRDMSERWRSAAAIIHARAIVGSDSAYRHNDMRVAADRWRDLVRDSERLGSLQGRAHGYLHLAASEADLGRKAASEEALREVGPLVAQLGPSHRHHVAYELAVATLVPSLHRGSWEAMRQTSARTMERLVGHQTPLGLLLLGYSAMAEAFSPDPGRYEERIEALLCSLEGTGRDAFLARESLNYGVIALHERQDVRRAQRFERLVRDTLAQGIKGGRFGESFDAALGMLAAVLGQHAKAREHFAQARRSLEATSLLSLRALVDLQDARVLGATGDAEGWRSQLEQAQRRFDELGMTLWSDRAAALLVAGPPPRSANPHASGPDGLSPREMEILRKLAEGGSAKSIASDLGRSVATVNRHVANIYVKIGVNTRVAAAAYALKHKLDRD